MTNRVVEYDLSLAIWDDDAAAVLAVGAGQARTAQLSPGLYYLVADTALHFKQGGSAVTATANSNYLPAGGVVEIRVPDDTLLQKDFVSVIQHASSGTAYLNKPSVS